MQYLLNEKEYNKLKRSEIILNNIKQYILDSSENEANIDYICTKHGKKILSSTTGIVININPLKIFKMLDVEFDDNIVINIINN